MTARHVTVIGAGFSGLTAAHQLVRAGYDVEIVERAATPGGLIATLRTEWGTVETAANGALNTHRLEALAEELGVRLLCPAPAAKKRYLYRDGPSRFPLRAGDLPAFIGFVARFIMNRRSVAPRPQESVRAWATRVMGPAAARYLVEGALQGIYSGNPERLSASVILGRFFDRRPREPRPRHRGIVAPEGGMGELVNALHARLRDDGVAFRTQQVEPLRALPDHPHVIATGARAARDLLDGAAPELARALRAFDLSTLITITAFFPDHCVRGFGCLFPPQERRRALGVLVNTDIFPNRSRNYVSETWILGGADGASALRAAELLQMTDAQLIDIVLDERAAAFGATSKPAGYRVTRWPETIPHYSVDLEAVLPVLERGADNIFLHGNYLGQIGLAKILDRAAALPALIAARGRWA